MITTDLLDVTGQAHPVAVDQIRAVSWTNPNASPYVLPPPPGPETTVRLTLTMVGDTPALSLTVRYREVTFLTTHYGRIIAQNAADHERQTRLAARVVGR